MKMSNLKEVIKKINYISENITLDHINIMEVCGTHTNLIAKLGIKNILCEKVNLISGPGCPVCVTPESYIDAAIDLSRQGVIIATFGDLIKVNGSEDNLFKEKSNGRDIRIIYSVWDLIKLAMENENKNIVFLGVGFETTAPLIASIIKETVKLKIHNLYFLISLKTMPTIIEKILSSKEKNIHGILCPGNVAVVRGASDFKFIYEKYKIPAVICGFSKEDIIGSIYFLIRNIEKLSESDEKGGFENLYRRFVNDEGNKKAKDLIKEVFEKEDTLWRGIGVVESSGLKISEKYSSLDAVNKFNLQKYFYSKDVNIQLSGKKCRCRDVLLGNITPDKCKLFGEKCTPKYPLGPCMVSNEGSCLSYYRYIK